MNALELHGLTRSFGSFTLGPLDLTLPSGCIMGLIGENGAGKSTTIKLILGMLRADAGEISILGQKVPDAFPRLKEDLGVVLDEVGLPECVTPLQLNQILKYAYRQWEPDTYFSYLDRLALPRDKQFKEFSRGMKMKLGIAAALSHRPRLLLLDEATSGLDPVVREEILDVFLEFTRDEGHSILISSHIVSDLEKLCDYITFLHKGKILLSQEKDRLAEEYGLLRCSPAQLEELDRNAVLGQRVSAYGAEVLVKRDLVPSGLNLSPIGVEDLFIYMAKEAG